MSARPASLEALANQAHGFQSDLPGGRGHLEPATFWDPAPFASASQPSAGASGVPCTHTSPTPPRVDWPLGQARAPGRALATAVTTHLGAHQHLPNQPAFTRIVSAVPLALPALARGKECNRVPSGLAILAVLAILPILRLPLPTLLLALIAGKNFRNRRPPSLPSNPSNSSRNSRSCPYRPYPASEASAAHLNSPPTSCWTTSPWTRTPWTILRGRAQAKSTSFRLHCHPCCPPYPPYPPCHPCPCPSPSPCHPCPAAAYMLPSAPALPFSAFSSTHLWRKLQSSHHPALRTPPAFRSHFSPSRNLRQYLPETPHGRRPFQRERRFVVPKLARSVCPSTAKPSTASKAIAARHGRPTWIATCASSGFSKVKYLARGEVRPESRSVTQPRWGTRCKWARSCRCETSTGHV